MNALSFVKTLTLAALAAASSHLSAAAPVTYWFSGQVTDFYNGSNAAPAGIGIGTPFVGRISYDPTAVWYADTNNSSGGISSQYHYGNPATGFSFTVHIAGHVISNALSSGINGQIGMEDNVSGRDYYYAESGSSLLLNGTNMVASPNQSGMAFGLVDSSATALTSTALPLNAPVLSRFSDSSYLTISARNSNGSVELFYLSGSVSAIRTNEIVILAFRRLNSTTAQLAWPRYTSGYTLQSAPNPVTGTWQNVAAPVTDVGTEHTVNVSTTGSPKFYRLKK